MARVRSSQSTSDAVLAEYEWPRRIRRPETKKRHVSTTSSVGSTASSSTNCTSLTAISSFVVAIGIVVYFSIERSTVETPNRHTNSISQRWTQRHRENFGYFVDPKLQPMYDTELVAAEMMQKTKEIAASKSVHHLPSPNEEEALTTLSAAVIYRQSGKHSKAARLFEHALALAPNHPDVLTEYGVYHETVTDDVLTAESMYTKALSREPKHSYALQNRARTQPLVEEIDNRLLQTIDDRQQYFMRIPRGNRALRRAMREAYFAHVYHTVALEGNTMSYAQTRSILETHLAVGGKSIVEHNEIMGMDAAMRFLNHTLVHRIGRISLDDILQIHQRVLGHVDPVEAGRWRTTAVWVGQFQPCPASEVPREMDGFIEWLNSEATFEIHPVELAALAHYKFVFIHPFIDGNGRTARLLMNMILMQAGFPPIIIRVNDRLSYYEALKTANDGDVRPFIRLIGEATIRTLSDYIESSTASVPDSQLQSTIKL